MATATPNSVGDLARADEHVRASNPDAGNLQLETLASVIKRVDGEILDWNENGKETTTPRGDSIKPASHAPIAKVPARSPRPRSPAPRCRSDPEAARRPASKASYYRSTQTLGRVGTSRRPKI
jgi:hypothetical protein